MKKCLFIIISALFCIAFGNVDWGFFGHKQINRLAVFTLPQEMIGFYKEHIEYLTEHAVDPDKRRYAIKNEATRHYIDIDHFDTIPFKSVPRDFHEALYKYGSFNQITKENDTIVSSEEEKLRIWSHPNINQFLIDDRYSNVIDIPDSLSQQVNIYNKLYFANELAAYGTLPYFLEEFYKRLVYAFQERDSKKILKISADIGHYISDAHVPLHTTVNYNGQLTNQLGIHAFWESKLPELFAEEEYDFLVGKAEYIKDIRTYIWSIITESHRLLPDVLSKELEVKRTFPEDRQYCFDERNDITVRIECPEFAEAYHNALNGMVESRMQASILAIGSFWFSAWVEAGQPDLDNMNKVAYEIQKTEKPRALNSNHHQ